MLWPYTIGVLCAKSLLGSAGVVVEAESEDAQAAVLVLMNGTLRKSELHPNKDLSPIVKVPITDTLRSSISETSSPIVGVISLYVRTNTQIWDWSTPFYCV